MRRRRVLHAATLALAAALAAGCGQLRPQDDFEFYEAALSGAQQVPAVRTAASGTAEVRLNERNNTITWKVTHSGLASPVTAAHIHGPAGPGQNGAPAILLGGKPDGVIEGSARLTPQQATELTSGLWYVSLRTAAHPEGELRGQLRRR